MRFSSSASNEDVSISPPLTARRWLAGGGIVLLGLLALLAVQWGLLRITRKPSTDLVIIVGVIELTFYVWLRKFSRLSIGQQMVTGFFFIGLQLCAFYAVRIEGFAGTGRLMFAWRWTPTPEEQFDASRNREELSRDVDLVSPEWTPADNLDYPAFRGRDRAGHVTGIELETDWQRFPPRQLWRRPIGRGWSSFAVVGNFCVTQEQRREDEVVVCYELTTGRELWVHRDRARFNEPTGGVGPRATPAITNGRVYTLGATGILNCLDRVSGERIWSANVLADNNIKNRLFGMAGSPLIIGFLVVVTPGGKGSSLVAYNATTGEVVWKGGDAEASYSSAHLAPFDSRKQILSFNAEGLFSHDLENGRVLWSYGWVSNPTEKNNVCQPIPLPRTDTNASDRVFISSGYGKGSALLEIDQRETEFSVRPKWINRKLKAKFSSVMLHEGYVYGLDGSILTCIQLDTGKRQWKGGRYGYGQLILVGSVLLIQMESGEVALVEASPESHRELTRFTALGDRTWNHPVVVGRRLLVRNDREAACYELPLKHRIAKDQ